MISNIGLLDIIVEIIAIFIESYIIYDIFQLLFSNKKTLGKNKLNWLFIFISIFLMIGLNTISLISPITIIIMVLFWSISAKFIYSENYVITLSITGIYALITIGYDFLFILSAGRGIDIYIIFTNLIESTYQMRILLTIINKGIFLVGYFIIRRFLKKIRVRNTDKSFLFKVTVLGFVACLILGAITYIRLPLGIAQVWFVFLLILIISLFSYSINTNINKNKKQLEMVEENNKILEENLYEIKEIYMKNAILYHDINNHLDIINKLLEKEETKEAKGYLENICKPIEDLKNVTWTGIEIIDVVLNSKKRKAEKEHISIKYNIDKIKVNKGISNDISIILSNLLDNAIEGSIRGNEGSDYSRLIKVAIKKINEFIIIKVVNNISGTIKEHKGNLITTKKEKGLHGWGIKSIESIVGKNAGHFKYEYDEKEFKAVVLLFL